MENYLADVSGPYFTPQRLTEDDYNLSNIEWTDSVFKNTETELMGTSCGLQAKQEEQNQVEILERLCPKKAKGGSGRAKLTPDQKRENKKESDDRYRKKQKRKLEELTDEISSLKKENVRLNEELSRFKSVSQQHDCKSLSFQPKCLEGNGGSDVQNQHQQIPVTTNKLVADQLFLQKVEADEKSNISLSDFKGLDGEVAKLGNYSFPLSLLPTVKRIIDVYGDVSATSKMNLFITQVTYTIFCASVKEMGEVQLQHVTEEKIIKWRDAIKDALRIDFKVEFAMEHLMRIAHAYIGRTKIQELAQSISKLEAEVNTRRAELAERNMLCKNYMDAAEKFNGKSLSLFP